jgi:SAM-dependent methyltransferase
VDEDGVTRAGPRTSPSPAPPPDIDKFMLYELAVTGPDRMAPFLYALHGKRPKKLGEDFSGTAAVSRGWLRYKRGLRAVAVDQDPDVLARVPRTPGLRTLATDVLKARDKADVIAATNFPICYWHTRRDLLRYLRHVRSRMLRGGIFVADLYGGPLALRKSRRTKPVKLPEGGSVTYVWDQKSIDPLTMRVFNAIHFRWPDGRVMRDAFTYDWRLWSIPELRDAMAQAGFKSSEVHDRLGAAVDALGNVYVKPVEEGELERDYIVYVVART